MRDADLLPRVQQCAERLLLRAPEQVAALAARWVRAGGIYGSVG